MTNNLKSCSLHIGKGSIDLLAVVADFKRFHYSLFYEMILPSHFLLLDALLQSQLQKPFLELLCFQFHPTYFLLLLVALVLELVVVA
jgi:hypothetical protein